MNINFKVIDVKEFDQYFEVEIEFLEDNAVYKATDRYKQSFPLGQGWDYIFPDGTPKFIKQISKHLRDLNVVKEEEQEFQVMEFDKLKSCKNQCYNVVGDRTRKINNHHEFYNPKTGKILKEVDVDRKN
jgi:hypothetical protein